MTANGEEYSADQLHKVRDVVATLESLFEMIDTRLGAAQRTALTRAGRTTIGEARTYLGLLKTNVMAMNQWTDASTWAQRALDARVQAPAPQENDGDV